VAAPYVPFYYSASIKNCEKGKEGDYIFAGGNCLYRDYETLLKAVEGLDTSCVIATQNAEHLSNLDIPKNVKVCSLPSDEYFQCMADSKMVVVPLRKDYGRSAGQRSYLDPMYLKKPVIVCDDKGVYDYITDREEGVIVSSGDFLALRDSIQWVLKGSQEVESMILKAREKVQQFSIDGAMRKVLSIAQGACGK